MSRFLRFHLPPLLLAAIILSAANDTFSSTHTGGMLTGVLRTLFGNALRDEMIEAVNFTIRKCAHIGEYGLLGWLSFRSWRAERSGWRLRWAVQAVLFVIVIASADEWLQSRTTARTGTPYDVVVDAAGATLAQLIVRRRGPEEGDRTAALH